MVEIFRQSAYFGLALTLLVFQGAVFLSKKVKLSFLNPILVSGVVIVLVLLIGGIEYQTYQVGADFISRLLTPATVCYAVPLYRQLHILKQHLSAVIISILCGCFTALGSVWVFSKVFQFEHDFYVSVLPKSITTAIGVSLSEELGGIVSITVAAIIITGIFGGAAAVLVCRLFKIVHPAAKGLAIGTAAHAVGTAKAIEMGDVEGAMSSLAIVVAGLLTVLLAPSAAGW